MIHSIWALIPMVFLLGLRHGFDLDHLATIDAMTRQVKQTPVLARMTGFFFSLGHGLVVIAISLLIGTGLFSAHIPNWLEELGQGISIAFLMLFGMLTLWNVFRHPSQKPHSLSLKSRVSQKLLPKRLNPLLICAIGALFALSFDTFSQVALFSLSASALAGGLFTALFGVIFMLGMMVSDGLNGLVIARMLQGAERTSLRLSRLAGLLIALFSLGVGLSGLLQFCGPF